MPKYAEVNAEGLVTKVFDNDGDYYAPEKDSFLIQSSAFAVGSRYEPVAGNIPLAYPFLGVLTVLTKGKKSVSDEA